MGVIRKIFSVPYEKRLLISSTVTLIISLLIAVGKILIGAFSDVTMCAVGVFNVLLMSAKSNCVIGAIKNDGSFKRYNTFTAVFLFLSGAAYTAYMTVAIMLHLQMRSYDMWQAITVAAIAFTELGVAIYGLIKTKRRGHYYRNIKIISLVSALVAIMTAQMAILSFTSAADYAVPNSASGIAVGVVTMLLAVFVYFAPQFSSVDREHNVFELVRPADNKIIDTASNAAQISLCKSKVYGGYTYSASVSGGTVDGHIVREKSCWHTLPLAVKILCVILSEILIFVWAAGYVVFFVRSVDMPSRLEKLMTANGFEKAKISEERRVEDEKA